MSKSNEDNRIIRANIVGDGIISPEFLDANCRTFWRIAENRPDSVTYLLKRFKEGITAKDICSVGFLASISELNKNIRYKTSHLELTLLSDDRWLIKITFKEKKPPAIAYVEAGPHIPQEVADALNKSGCHTSVADKDYLLYQILRKTPYEEWKEYPVRDILFYIKTHQVATTADDVPA